MGSDRARISFDPHRDYRSVVAQQGRVTLEADVNEQALIAGEALREDTIDIVGPAGTPDNGYQVLVDSSGNLLVGPGTMYVGGWRMEQQGTVALNSQPEWLDRPGQVTIPQGDNSVVALLVTEQEITATEDQALVEVALGGPDTAARTRLMQHLVQIPTSQSTCAAAETDIATTLNGMGLSLDQNTLEMSWAARLQVNPFTAPTTNDPCCPTAQGGYLGSDNQLVRVTAWQNSAGNANLLWGWNNASFLYRATVNPSSNPVVLTLSQAPVDSYHFPKFGQVIEVLQTTTVLGNPNNANYVAAPNGQVIPLTTGFKFESNGSNGCALTLPAGVTLTSNSNPGAVATVFIRIWESQVTLVSGALTALNDSTGAPTGINITVTMTDFPSNPIVAWPYWCFAVRPNTPQKVYPQRIYDNPQPPNGPRQWLCELAVYTGANANAAAGTTSPVFPDCRIPFLPLTKLGVCDCCFMTLDPSSGWQGKLAAVLSDDSVKAISVCFEPGEFVATSTITVTGKNVKMTGAGLGTIIAGNGLEVVLQFSKCECVILTDLSVVAGISGDTASNNTKDLQGAVTVLDCTQVDIERVVLECEDADFRSASCLYVKNTPLADGLPALETNLRVLNSEFVVGNAQVGILLVNAYHARVEGNIVTTPNLPRNISYKNIGSFAATASRLRKHLISGLTLTSTLPKTKKEIKREQKKQAGKAKPAIAGQDAAKTIGATSPKAEKTVAGTKAPILAPVFINAMPRIKLGDVGRAMVKATFGTVDLELISSDKLGNAFSSALKKAITTTSPSMAEVRQAVSNIAILALKSAQSVAPAFANYVNGVFQELVSTSSQGIVVGGIYANDIRILQNIVKGTAQGIHVGLSFGKSKPPKYGLQAEVVQICGNTVNIRLTPEITCARHGIYIGGVTGVLISDNTVGLARSVNAGQDFTAIVVQGVLGPRVLIERNLVAGQSLSCGVFAASTEPTTPSSILWKVADNWSSVANSFAVPPFISTDNQP